MGTFVVSKKNNGDFKFVFASRKGKTIFTSTGFSSYDECEKNIEVVKTITDYASFVKFRSSSGKYFFRLVVDGFVIAASRKYTTMLLLEKGIKEIILYSSVAEILDFCSDFVFPELNEVG